MSFSLFEGGRWVFVIITFAVIAFCLFAIWKKWIDHPFGLISLASVLGGAVMTQEESIALLNELIEVAKQA